MTGIYSFVTQLQSETSSSVDLRSNEAAIIRDALFGLTRLTVNTIGQFHNFMDNDGAVDADDNDDDDDQMSNLECLKEFVHTTLNTASPIWIADVIAMD
ncbi:unnamed protein product, partial [Trichobilharzia regenti]